MMRKLSSALIALFLVLTAVGAPRTARADEALAAQMAKTQDILQEAQNGKGLTQFRVGHFVADLLAFLCDRDQELSAFIHRDNMFTETYLMNTFQYHAAEEIAAVGKMAPSPTRQAARWGLEALLHIPSADDPALTQTQDRAQLIAALASVDSRLRALGAHDAP